MQRERASRKDLQEQEGNFRAQETRRSSVHPARQSQGGGTARRQKWRQGSYRRQHCFSSSICATCASTTIIHNDHHACKRHFGHCSEGLRRIRCLTVTPVHEAGGVMRIKSQIPLHGKGGVWQKQPPPPPTNTLALELPRQLVPYMRQSPDQRDTPAVASIRICTWTKHSPPQAPISEESRRRKPRSTSEQSQTISSPSVAPNNEESRHRKPRSTRDINTRH